jgi:ferritin-like metal-binding protein YciE
MPKKNARKSAEMTLRDLLVMQLKMLYDVETQLVKALPKMAKKSTNADLRRGFERHLKQTQGHVSRLENVFDALEMRPQKIQNGAIRGLVADADSMMKNVKGSSALDAGLIATAQCVENYEMAEYSSALGWAKLLNQYDIADSLQETFDEEQETSDELAEMAHSEIDEAALGEHQEGDKILILSQVSNNNGSSKNKNEDEMDDEDEEAETESDLKTEEEVESQG